MYGPRCYICPLVNVDHGQYIRHRVHRDVQLEITESGVAVMRRCVTKEVQTYLVGEHIYRQLGPLCKSSLCCVWLRGWPPGMRMMAPFLVKIATLSLAPVAPLESRSPLNE